MKLLNYHEDIGNYITSIYLYQIIIKPYNDKLTKFNLKIKIQITTLLLIFVTIQLFTIIYRTIKAIKWKN